MAIAIQEMDMATERDAEREAGKYKGYIWLQNSRRRWDTAWALGVNLENRIRDVQEHEHFIMTSILVGEELVGQRPLAHGLE